MAVSAWLSKAVGEKVPVKPVLILPGWWVERTASGLVAVLNPKEIHKALPMVDVQPLEKTLAERVAYQLSERCRMGSS